MMIEFIVVAMLSAQSPTPVQPRVYPSPRLAAVAFAIQNGFKLPRANLIVANEVAHGDTVDVPRLPTDRRTTLPLEETLRDAEAIATLLGPGVKTGWAKDLLRCSTKSWGSCVASTSASVLAVDEPPNNEMAVRVKFYAPGARIYYATVEIQKQASGWVATRFSTEPKLFADGVRADRPNLARVVRARTEPSDWGSKGV
jgi:hypothetical protein